jgi:hypothetical protein
MSSFLLLCSPLLIRSSFFPHSFLIRGQPHLKVASEVHTRHLKGLGQQQ